MRRDYNNSRKSAVALGFDRNQGDAPRVLAKGKGIVAENMIEMAKENEVPIQEDPSLIELLSELDINQSIPEELFQAVAEVFAFVYRADREVRKLQK
jgi:flagellar biosynthesis protein